MIENGDAIRLNLSRESKNRNIHNGLETFSNSNFQYLVIPTLQSFSVFERFYLKDFTVIRIFVNLYEKIW